jgi:DNA invertase Pin-like site-specific DNA recombinase
VNEDRVRLVSEVVMLSDMDAIIPVRLSQKAKGHKQTGMETQDEDAVRWAEARGFNIVAVIPDTRTGAGDWMERKNLRPWLIDPIECAKYKHIICLSQDRLSRGVWRDEIAIRMWAEDNGKEIWIIDTNLHWPPKDDMQRMAWEYGASRARAYYEDVKKKSERNQRHLATHDYLINKPCFGTMIVAKDAHTTLAPDLEYAPTAIEMVDRAIGGESSYDIARWLSAEGIPVPDDIRRIRKASPEDPPKRLKWSPKTVGDVLRNRALVGERKQRFGRILHFDPILAKEDGTPDYAKFQRLQAALKASSRRRGKVRNTPAMLTDIAHCAKCHRIMHARFTTTKVHGREYHWAGYRCDGTHIEPSKCKVMTRMDKTDLAAWEALEPFDALPYFVTMVDEGHDWQDEIADNRDRIASLDPDADNYDEEHARLIAERKDLQSRPVVPNRVVTGQRGTIGDRREACTTPNERRELFLKLGWKVFLNAPDKRGGDPIVTIEPSGSYIEEVFKLAGLNDDTHTLEAPWRLLADIAERGGLEAEALRAELRAAEVSP